MLFKDILDSKNQSLQSDFDNLFDDIINHQTHSGDLLLVRVNTFYNPDVLKFDNFDEKPSPYVIGPGYDGLSYKLHNRFINNYHQQAVSNKTHREYLKLHEWSEDRKEEIRQIEDNESYSIQLEMLVYLKIWEADLFIKQLYQITRLSFGEPYDWHFSIAESNRDKNSTGTRQKIIRNKIRDRVKNKYPEIYSAIKNAYRTQIRNAIAHSKYFFQGRHINLNNYIEGDQSAQMKALSFDEWIDIIHDTMVLYNQLIGLFNKADKYYESLASKNNLLQEVRVTRKFVEERTEYNLLKFRQEFKDWS